MRLMFCMEGVLEVIWLIDDDDVDGETYLYGWAAAKQIVEILDREFLDQHEIENIICDMNADQRVNLSYDWWLHLLDSGKVDEWFNKSFEYLW
jgi:hypothetical protein